MAVEPTRCWKPPGKATGCPGWGERCNGLIGGKILSACGYHNEGKRWCRLLSGLVLFRLVAPPLQSGVVGPYLVLGVWFTSCLPLGPYRSQPRAALRSTDKGLPQSSSWWGAHPHRPRLWSAFSRATQTSTLSPWRIVRPAGGMRAHTLSTMPITHITVGATSERGAAAAHRGWGPRRSGATCTTWVSQNVSRH
jgi:hypothetical protein